MNQQQRNDIAKMHSMRHRSHEKKAAKLISLTLAKQGKILSTFVTKHGIPAAISHLDRIIRPEPMKLALHKIWHSVAADYSKLTKLIKKDGAPTRHTDYMASYMASQQSAAKVTDITDTTRERLRNTLKQAIGDKLHKRDIAKRIQESSGLSKERSLLIARTETTMAANMGAMTSAVSQGVKLAKYWIATDDDRTREAHSDMDSSESVPMDSPFVVGGEEMLYPGDPTASAENVCNCRCVVAFRPVSVLESQGIPEDSPTQAGRARARVEGHSGTTDRTIEDAILALINELTAGETVIEDEESN